MKRTLSFLCVLSCALPAAARAQAPATAPVVLTVPPSARVAALGGAWAAGRDQDVIFSNPAQLINTRTDFGITLARLGPKANSTSFSTAYAAGKLSLTLGFGVQMVNFTAQPGETSPFSPDRLLMASPSDAQSSVIAAGGAILYKTMRIGASAKYVADRTAINQHAIVMDFGVARNLFSGTAALSVQNIGHKTLHESVAATLPRQVALGWSRTKPIGPLDFALFTQVAHRSGWNSAAAGLETGFSWIEGYSVTARIGARRPETTTEKPISAGASFSGDRLTIDYAVRFFEGSRRSHLVTLRWR